MTEISAEESDSAFSCYTHYKQKFDRPPTVQELWAWLDEKVSSDR